MGLREERKIRFREAILDAALEIFSEQGYHSAQMADIAEKAKVANGTLYNLFKTKENLYQELIHASMLEIALPFSEILESDADPLECLKSYIRIKGEIFGEHEKVVRLVLGEIANARAGARVLITEKAKPLYDTLLLRLAEIFERGQGVGQIDPELSPYDLAVSLDSLTNSFIALELEQAEMHPYSDKIDLIETLFFKSILTPDSQSTFYVKLNSVEGKIAR